MTRQEMLDQMKLNHDEFKDLLLKLALLRFSLNESQRAVFDRSLPSPSAAAETFGANVTTEHLQELLGAEVRAHVPGGFIALVAVLNK
jgi:hypothetical protein